uniref:Uncharacterized protein n=1 Tax=Peronospora matthiolae TaxID=2874970 RepID=A0AAV1TMC2_9STRA
MRQAEERGWYFDESCPFQASTQGRPRLSQLSPTDQQLHRPSPAPTALCMLEV